MLGLYREELFADIMETVSDVLSGLGVSNFARYLSMRTSDISSDISSDNSSGKARTKSSVTWRCSGGGFMRLP